MRARVLSLMAALALAACGAAEPNPYPAEARTHFESSCPPDSAVCSCTWDNLTRTLTYEEYEAALARFREEGLMDPRVTRARTQCLERHRE
ncbi:hypothetical protein [Vitreimonas flagellata]|uniref:hypothetical protein n=1 Tax=Vitreimonas flagellata TaxID=2560861 RepID=UPI00107525C3|nr:hypothetical protein [Vitreimonas flagellata]